MFSKEKFKTPTTIRDEPIPHPIGHFKHNACPTALTFLSYSMLTESFIASILSSDKVTKNPANKVAGIYNHECQPLPSLKSSFKKSSTKPNCLAVNASHIFAAQADKAVVHVYNRDRGNQEAIVPFPEKISSLALIGRYDGAGILALGTEGGRVLLWEVYFAFIRMS